MSLEVRRSYFYRNISNGELSCFRFVRSRPAGQGAQSKTNQIKVINIGSIGPILEYCYALLVNCQFGLNIVCLCHHMDNVQAGFVCATTWTMHRMDLFVTLQ